MMIPEEFPIFRTEVRTKFGRRLAENSFEHPVKLRERLKSDIVGDLADSPARVEQLRTRVFKPDPGNVIGKFKAG